jgi:two-component system LytT family response regulator
MKKIKVFVVEDEINAREVLIDMLNLIDSSLEVIGFTDNVVDAVIMINDLKPQILFLDIHIKNGNGFDVLNNLDDFTGKVVFTTAHADYAIKAFQYSALDYILKPISPLQLKNVVKKAKKEISKEFAYHKLVKDLRDEKMEVVSNPKIVIKTLKKQYVITISDIIRCESEGAYTKFFLKDSEILTSKNLKFYNNILEKYNFLRTHQSHLVNKDFVKSLDSNGFLELENGDMVPVSARKKSEISKAIYR